MLTYRANTTFFAGAFCLAMLLPLAAHAQTFTVLHSFTGQQDGGAPAATLTLDAGGNIYRTTSMGGNGPIDNCGGGGCGIAFKMRHRNSAWLLTPLYNFQRSTDGASCCAAFHRLLTGAEQSK